MRYAERRKPVISLFLILALLVMPVGQVNAQEIPETTQQTISEEPDILETTEAPAETEAPEIPGSPEETEISGQPEEPEISEELEAPESPVVPEIPEDPNPTEEAAEPETPEPQAEDCPVPRSVPISQVLQMTAGEESILMEGTVVYADAYQAVLQDETGGIRLSGISSAEVAPGDVLRISGRRSGGFSVETFEKLGIGALPCQESSLSDDCSGVRIRVTGAVLGYNSLSQNGHTVSFSADVPDEIKSRDRIDVCGVMLDGTFFADTLVLSEHQSPEIGVESDWNFYFGQLHAHTEISDGSGTVEEAFSWAKTVPNLDFFAVTDHSDSFDNGAHGVVTENGAAVSQEWAAGKQAARDVTDETFVGIFGYEMTWPEDLAIGHINTFHTPGWQTRDQPGMNTLTGYLNALAAVPESVSQFNHPGIAFGDFRSFSGYTHERDALVHLLEVGTEGVWNACDAYTTALDAGWHLAPSTSENNHAGNWAGESTHRTVILAKELTEDDIYDAIRNYRVYATQDADLKIEYHLNGHIMGSILARPEMLRADILLEDGSGDPVDRVEVITDTGAVAAWTEIGEAAGTCSLEVPLGGSYYYLRILRNGSTAAVTAPVWVDDYEDLGIADFTSDTEKPALATPAALTLTLYNRENLPFLLERVTFAAGEEIFQTVTDSGAVTPLGKLEIPVTYSQETAGLVTVRATVTGSIAGLSKTFTADLTLHYQPGEAKLLAVEKVREGLLGEAYRIRGFVTAGTANDHNTFPDSIYLQDETGGIEIMDFTKEGVQLGTPMEVVGILRSEGGNLMLAMTDYEILQEDAYRHVPRTMTNRVAMNYANHGGQLLQIEGHVVSITKTPDKKGVSRFTVRDILGDMATVIVEEDIGSGAYGTNELLSEVKLSGTTRAMGLLHIDEYGKPVLRVRNCDEVVYVPPVKDPTNPKTGDRFIWLKFWK